MFALMIAVPLKVEDLFIPNHGPGQCSTCGSSKCPKCGAQIITRISFLNRDATVAMLTGADGVPVTDFGWKQHWSRLNKLKLNGLDILKVKAPGALPDNDTYLVGRRFDPEAFAHAKFTDALAPFIPEVTAALKAAGIDRDPVIQFPKVPDETQG